jgi:hypothetical protein
MIRKAVTLLVVVAATIFFPNPPSIAQSPVPLVEITIPMQVGLNPAHRTPVATYEWQALAGSPDPVEVRWIMVATAEHNNDWHETEQYVRDNPDAPEWSPWHPYSPPSTGTSWTSPTMDFGGYVFAVHGRDGAGNADAEFTLDRNLRRVIVTSRTTGPLLRVTGALIDDIITTVTTTPVTEVDVNRGTPVSFCWEASAEDYGLPVTGYRFGWDVIDPEDDAAWPMPFTPFAQPVECSPDRAFSFGVHTFHVEVIDYDGFKSRVPIQLTLTEPVPTENTSWGRIKSLFKR